MKLEDQDLRLIEQHLDGSLPSKDKKTIDDRLQNDKEFSAIYQKTASGIEAIRSYRERTSMQKLQSIYQEEKAAGTLDSQGKIRRLGNLRSIGIAASIAILLTLGYFLLPSGGGQLDLYSSYYEIPSFDLVRSGQATTLESIAELYNNKQYQAAVEALNNYEQDQGLSFETQYYKALSLNEIGRTEEALDILDRLGSQNTRLDEVLWTTGLLQIKTGKRTEAKATLMRLLDGQTPITPARRNKVQEIIDSL
ncbi:MAG: tetratricopeptide repeat protein [Bacteroidota bacterium]